MPRQREAKHGTRGKYAQGCRCPQCREANSAYQRDYLARRAKPVPPRAPPTPEVVEARATRARAIDEWLAKARAGEPVGDPPPKPRLGRPPKVRVAGDESEGTDRRRKGRGAPGFCQNPGAKPPHVHCVTCGCPMVVFVDERRRKHCVLCVELGRDEHLPDASEIGHGLGSWDFTGA